MNKITFEKIRSATPFLLWFRYHLPSQVQTKVRPHLDRPQHLALNILDCCSFTQSQSVSEIAQLTGVTRETVRQVLLALKEGGMPCIINPTQKWQATQEGESWAASLSLLPDALDAPNTALESGTALQISERRE